MINFEIRFQAIAERSSNAFSKRQERLHGWVSSTGEVVRRALRVYTVTVIKRQALSVMKVRRVSYTVKLTANNRRASKEQMRTRLRTSTTTKRMEGKSTESSRATYCSGIVAAVIRNPPQSDSNALSRLRINNRC